jgi:hypothetical protein
MNKKIETEKIHEADRDFPFTVWRMRVPGGWLYQVGITCPVFVPEQVNVEPLVSDVRFTPLSTKHEK